MLFASVFLVLFDFCFVGNEHAGQIGWRGVGADFSFFKSISKIWAQAYFERAEK